MEEIDPKRAETAVIIPNFNGLKYLKACMSALESQTYRSFRVIIVDNGSTDGSVDFIEAYTGDPARDLPVGAIYLEENLGFAPAVNIGIDAAEGAEYIVLLNNDTAACGTYLEELIKPFKEPGAGRLGAVSPKMLKMSDPGLIDDAGDGYNILGWAFQRGVDHPAGAPRFGKRTGVLSACAGAAAYRASALSEIAFADGVFDPAHFAYLEDIDVSMRLRLAGYDIIYAPGSAVLHVGSGTSGSKYNDFKVRLAARNNIFILYKNFPFILLLINLPFLVAGTLIKAAFFAKKGFGGAYLAGLREGAGSLKTVRYRKQRTSIRRIGRYTGFEFMLIRDTFIYIRDFVPRKLRGIVKPSRG